MTAEPLGPALAAELGGEWDEGCEWVRLQDHVIWETVLGLVIMQKIGRIDRIRLGSHSDGVEALAAEARRLGVA